MRTAIGAACCIAVLALAGCSAHVSGTVGVGNGLNTTTSSTTPTVDSTKMASLVKRLTQKRGLAAQTVSCPSNIPERAGQVTTCVAYYTGGGSGRFRVVQTNGTGSAHATPAEMIPPEITDDIQHYLQPAHSFTASCPQHVPIVVGKTFHCTAQRRGQTVTLLVKVIDAGGGFHWSVVR